MFSILFIARTYLKDVFIAFISCALKRSETALNSGSLKSLPSGKMPGYQLGNRN